MFPDATGAVGLNLLDWSVGEQPLNEIVIILEFLMVEPEYFPDTWVIAILVIPFEKIQKSLLGRHWRFFALLRRPGHRAGCT